MSCGDLFRFDPFEDRLCRDVRNSLAESLMESIASGNIGPSMTVADHFKGKAGHEAIDIYINHRIEHYRNILKKGTLAHRTTQGFHEIACSLWDEELFFEFHEWLETKWHKAGGSEKAVFKALICAAGAYIHLEAGRISQSEKLAAKSIKGLIRHKEHVPTIFKVDLLISRLGALDPVPPKLGTTEP